MRRLTQEPAPAAEVGSRTAIEHTLAQFDADLRWLEETRNRVGSATAGSR